MEDESRMPEIGPRIREARLRQGMSQQQVADEFASSKQLVSHWENARSQLPVSTAIRLAALLEVSVQWLLTGGDPAGATQPPSVPLATAAELLEVGRGSLDPRRLAKRHYTDALCSKRALAFRVWDRAMVPRFEPGHLVTIDAEVLPEPGDLVVFVMLNSTEVLFRRYRPQAESLPTV